MTGTENEPKRLDSEHQARLQELVDKTHGPSMALMMWKRLSADERTKLGGHDVSAVEGFASAGDVYRKLHGGSPAEAVVKAAAKLKLIDGDTRAEMLGEIYRVEGHRGAGSVPYLDVAPEHAVTEIHNAMAENRLVLVDGSGIHSLIWEGKHIDVEWSKNPRAWEFLWVLALNASRGRAVDEYCFAKGARPLKERLQGLKRVLTKTQEIEELSKPLISLICQPDKESYQISLPSDQIWVRCLIGDRLDYGFEDIPNLNEIILAERSKLRREMRNNYMKDV